MRYSLIFAMGFALLLEPWVFAAPKYATDVAPLSKGSNAQYFKKNSAPDFWALMPYYVGQKLGQQCSAASLTMVLNGARTDQNLTSKDELVTIDSLLNKYSDEQYKKFMNMKLTPKVFLRSDFDRSNVGNKRLAVVLRKAVEKLGIKKSDTKVDLISLDLKNLDAGRKAFHAALLANEKSADDFIILSSFIQGKITGDPEGGAHVAPVAAYDAENKLVLILDPDRQWYEPYWAPEDKVFEAIADPKSDNENPGWIHFQVR